MMSTGNFVYLLSRFSRLGVKIVLLTWLFAACRQADPPPPTPTPVAEVQPVIPATPPPAEPDGARQTLEHRPLTVWVPAIFAVDSARPEEAVVAEAIDLFSAHAPDSPVEIVLKAEDGQASLLNYLSSAQRVAPSILPDLLLVDAQQLWQVKELGLAQPLTTTLLTQDDGFYPFVWAAVTIDEQTYGIPYFTAPLHLVYNTTRLESPPATWAELLDSGNRFAFPGAGQGGYADEWLLLQYLNAGGVWGRGSTVDPDSVLTLFQSIAQGRTRGTLPPEVMSFASSNAVWAALVAGDAEMASLPANIYLSQRSVAAPFAIAALPPIDGQQQTVAGVYAFALLTADADRQALALALLDHLLAPAVQSAWARAAGWLPTRQAAFGVWPVEDKDVALLQGLLEEAVALPGGPSFAELSKRLQLLLSGVMSGELSPEEAARAFQ